MTLSQTGAPAGSLTRLGGAIVASLVLHTVALEALTQAPQGWQAGAWSPSHAGTGRMRATLRTAVPGVEPKQPEALLEQPAPLQAPEATEPHTRDPAPAALAATANGGDDPPSFQPETEQGRAELPGSGALAAPFYYPANQLDQRPVIKTQIELEFPSAATAARGRVTLRLYLGAQGAVEQMAVVEADPPGVFEKSALDTFAAARFTPGIKNGVPVRSLLTIEVLFGEPAPLKTAPRY